MQSSSHTSEDPKRRPAQMSSDAELDDVAGDRSAKRKQAFLQVGVFLGLLGFGVFYDRLVGYVNRTYGQHGYTSHLVVFGVSVTIAALSPVIGAANTLRVVAGFAASGLPMILGDSSRHLHYRQEVSAALERARSLRREAPNAGQTPAREGQGPSVNQTRHRRRG